MHSQTAQAESRRTVVDESKVAQFDNKGRNGVRLWKGLKKNKSRARPADPVSHLVKQMEAALGDLEGKARLSTLARAFTRLAGEQMLEEGFFTEEELTAPPAVTWKNRDKSRKQNIVEHIEEQFKDRIGRGFRRADLRKSDPSADVALRQWLVKPSNEIRTSWPCVHSPEEFIALLHRDAVQLRSQRAASLARKIA